MVDAKRDIEAEIDFEFLKEFITSVRKIRQDNSVPSSRKLKILIQKEFESREFLVLVENYKLVEKVLNVEIIFE